ncbi:MAG: arginine--tRNA ligase, partial [Patescibacteria group bacterium]
MQNETGKNWISHLLASALSDLKLTSYLDSLDIKVPDLNFGDYSTNAALILAKKLKENPKEAANKIIEKIQENAVAKDLVTMQEAGGFINFTLTPQFLLNNLNRILDQGDLYGCSVNGGGKTVIIEYFQNNVAKPPHVGHLRSAVIGDCLLRVFRSQGFKAVSDTHIGDWGTQFGILLFAYKEFIKAGGEKKLIEADPIDELNKLYVGMSAKIEADPALRDLGKEEFAKLEQGNTENRELWQWFVRVSLEDFENYRKILEVLPFDHNLGESFYEDKMPPILAELKQKGLLVESQGAQVVNLEPQKMGFAVLVKSDGATTYLTRDVATIKYRIEDMKLE